MTLLGGVTWSQGRVLADGPGFRGESSVEELLELLSAGRPAWSADAACREHPEVDFYPGRGEDARPAKLVCSGCLVREECLGYALANGDQHGVWGGLSERERRRVRQGRRSPTFTPPAPPLAHGTRGCYAKGCRRPECVAANRVYARGVAARRRAG